MSAVSSSGPCLTHGDPAHARCRTHECCIGHQGSECRNPDALTTTLEAETIRILRLYDDYCSRNDQGLRSWRLCLVTWLADAFSLPDEEARRVYALMITRPNKRPAPY